MKRSNVIVAGGGIGGLTAALALMQRGHAVKVLEQVEDLKEVGAGVQLSANATRVLISLGLKETLESVACLAVDKQIRHYRTGQAWKVAEVGASSQARYGAPYWMIHRGDLHSALVRAVRAADPEALVLGTKCSEFSQTDTEVTVRSADGRTFTADVLIGADGIHSFVKQKLLGDFKAEFTGRAAWRGLVPSDRLPAHLRELVSTNWIGPGANVVTYPVRGGELINFVGAVLHPEWFEESWTATGSKEELNAVFADWHPDIRLLASSIEQPMKWAYRGREPLQQWTSGRITLLGDAAHPTLPTLAQGACMAIEDGVVLARCLSEFDPNEALQVYEQTRIGRTSKIVRSSNENATRFQDNVLADPEGAERYIKTNWEPETVAARYHWLYEFDALTTELGPTSQQ